MFQGRRGGSLNSCQTTLGILITPIAQFESPPQAQNVSPIFTAVCLQGIIHAYKTGLALQGNTTMGRWDMVGSFFFSVSAITTIGYGNLSPTTAVARVVCIFFALFGIPLNVILLNRIGQLMLAGVQHCSRHLGEKFRWQDGATMLTRTCALVTGLLLFLLLPPFLFSAIEGWTYEEGFYYSFITLSTIGFGDYVIGMNPGRFYPSWYKNVVSLWILFGMAWLALVINLCISLLENSSNLCHCCKKRSKDVQHGVQKHSQGCEPDQRGLDPINNRNPNSPLVRGSLQSSQ
uniref:Potassium two pore domain channel subfamily K member 17 n=1 Tax=Sphenodon punctatus TaxID=8508 RepID=A0A8D0H6G5_SPHPU